MIVIGLVSGDLAYHQLVLVDNLGQDSIYFCARNELSAKPYTFSVCGFACLCEPGRDLRPALMLNFVWWLTTEDGLPQEKSRVAQDFTLRHSTGFVWIEAGSQPPR